MQSITIRKLTKQDGGFYTATVDAVKDDGEKVSIEVHNRYGAWFSGENPSMKEVLPWVAARLQEKIRPIEKKEAKDAEENTADSDVQDGANLGGNARQVPDIRTAVRGKRRTKVVASNA